MISKQDEVIIRGLVGAATESICAAILLTSEEVKDTIHARMLAEDIVTKTFNAWHTHG
jgi:hypothetical protein